MTTTSKPLALRPGSTITVFALSSPVDESRLRLGCDELERLGYRVHCPPATRARQGYFAGNTIERLDALKAALDTEDSKAIICARGGYGATHLLHELAYRELAQGAEELPDDITALGILLGHSDACCLQIYLWQKFGWVTFYGPMVAAGFDRGAGTPGGYDFDSFHRAVTETREGWALDLQGDALVEGEAEGVLVGGCLTLVQTTLGTPWELDTRGSVLLLEDRGMKPYQVDRALMHLMQAGKLMHVRGIVLGEFPECEPPAGSDVTVRDVLHRVLRTLEIPVLWRAPIGHTPRPMLTVPLGVRARLIAHGAGRLDILEPACVEPPPSA